jgi:microcystin-dependent protein
MLELDQTDGRADRVDAYRSLLGAALRAGPAALRVAERWLATHDLFYLLTVLLRRRDLDHDFLFARCQEVQASPNGHLDLWAREHGKTSIISFGLTIQDIIRDPEVTIGLFSHTRPMAKRILRQVKIELERNQRLKALFDDALWAEPRRQAPKWSEDDGLVVRRVGNPGEATLEAWGMVDGLPTGKHFKVRVYDIVTGQMVDTFYDGALNSGAGGFSLNSPPTASLAAPAGTIVDFGGILAPTGWLLCYGQAVSRTIYSALFTALSIKTAGDTNAALRTITNIASTAGMAVGNPLCGTNIAAGSVIASVDSATQITMNQNAAFTGTAGQFFVTPHGVGDGSSTFNLPDLRGRASAGLDNMGGTAANRITAAISGVTGTTLGAAGGDQRLHAHSHSVNDPSHVHGVNDPGHQHLLHSIVDNLGSGSAFGGASANLEITDRYTDGAGTGIFLSYSGTGISLNNAGAGGAQNLPPALMLNKIIKT